MSEFQDHYRAMFDSAKSQCANPMHRNQTALRRGEYVEYCWFVEKTPVYARRPFVPILIANLLPTTRYLTVLRNPVAHVWSNYFHFLGQQSKRWADDPKVRERDIVALYEAVESISEINRLCTKISGIWKGMQAADRREKYIAMREHYKEIAVEYFKRRFVGPKDIMLGEHEQPGTKVIWATYHVPVLVIGMLANDEVFIEWDRWDPLEREMLNYRWMQFEFLWGDTLDSFRLIRCWMSQGLRIDNEHCEIQRDDPSNIAMFGEREKGKSKHSSTTLPFSDWFAEQIKAVFNPCTDLAVNGILHDRPNLLLGDWKQWKYFNY